MGRCHGDGIVEFLRSDDGGVVSSMLMLGEGAALYVDARVRQCMIATGLCWVVVRSGAWWGVATSISVSAGARPWSPGSFCAWCTIPVGFHA